jgi:predicted methyltransferase
VNRAFALIPQEQTQQNPWRPCWCSRQKILMKNYFFLTNKFNIYTNNVYTNMQKKSNIYIVKRRHFKVRSKKARYERDSLKSSHARHLPASKLYHYMYSYIHIVHVRTLTDKTHTDWLHTNA